MFFLQVSDGETKPCFHMELIRSVPHLRMVVITDIEAAHDHIEPALAIGVTTG